MRFEGKVLFATGGGSGLGDALARRFAAEGGRVAVADLDAARAAAVAAELPGALAIGCDVSDEAAVADAVARAHAELGRIDCVFNAAGHVVFGPIEQYPVAEFRRMLAVHVTGSFLVCRAVVPIMRGLGGGAIVNVASVAALVATPSNGAYSAAKGAIVSWSRQLALDLAADGIRVNVIAPGRVRTGMTIPLYEARGEGDYSRGAQLGARHNLQKRIAEPEEIAALGCFLLSDEASFLTGSVHVADGGETAR
jgi:NAD(P)-dependent dehydrogenase (short-subunit alcohol dehydrogenase family)